MITVITKIINNEWYFQQNGSNATKPVFIDSKTSVVLSEKALAFAFKTEAECYAKIKDLGLTILDDEI
jgi:hypothetical protein